VEMIYLKEDYFGGNGYYAEDIAVIVLANTITINDGVAPVCIDWNSKYVVPNGARGKVNLLY